MNQFEFNQPSQALAQDLFDPSWVEVSPRVVTICAVNLRKDRAKYSPLNYKTTPDARLHIRSYTDLETGRTNGLPIAKNPDGTFRFKQIVIDGMQSYDLSIREQALEYYVVSRHYEIEGSVNQKRAGTRARFYIEDAEKQAKESLERDRISSEIKEWIRVMSDEEMLNLARTVIEGADDMSPVVVKSQLIKKVETDYKLMYDRKTNQIRTASIKLLSKAMVLGLVKQEVSGFKGYDGTDLGGAQGAATDYLTSNKQYAIMLEARCRESEGELEKKKAKKVAEAEKLKKSLEESSKKSAKKATDKKEPEKTANGENAKDENHGNTQNTVAGKTITELTAEVTQGSTTPGADLDISLFGDQK